MYRYPNRAMTATTNRRTHLWRRQADLADERIATPNARALRGQKPSSLGIHRHKATSLHGHTEHPLKQRWAPSSSARVACSLMGRVRLRLLSCTRSVQRGVRPGVRRGREAAAAAAAIYRCPGRVGLVVRRGREGRCRGATMLEVAPHGPRWRHVPRCWSGKCPRPHRARAP